MSEYIRTTRACSVQQIQPELFEAAQNYFQAHRLGNLQADVLVCCETISRKKNTTRKSGWLHSHSDTIIYTAMLLTDQYLVWLHQGDQSGIRVNAARLSQIRAEFYASPLTQDAGLEIVGYLEDTNHRVRGYISMEAGSAAQEFCEQVQQAIARANPPTKRDFRWWLN